MRSTGPAPWFAISTNSSDALDPPVWTSDTTRVETGQAPWPRGRRLARAGWRPPAGSTGTGRRRERARHPPRAGRVACVTSRRGPSGRRRTAIEPRGARRAPNHRCTRAHLTLIAHVIHYDGAHPPRPPRPHPGDSVARAKRTHRAEARRRYRSEQSLAAQDDADTIDGSDDAAPPARTDSSAGTAQASAPRQGVGNAFRAAFRPVDIRSDLRALPQLVRHRALWIPVAITIATTVLFIVIRPEGRSDLLGVLTVFLYQYFVVTPAIGGVFIAGFLAPKASWLYGDPRRARRGDLLLVPRRARVHRRRSHRRYRRTSRATWSWPRSSSHRSSARSSHRPRPGTGGSCTSRTRTVGVRRAAARRLAPTAGRDRRTRRPPPAANGQVCNF